MRITHVGTVDIAGGAARSAYRLHCGLRRIGQDSKYFVEFRESKDETVVGYRYPRDPLTRVERAPRRWRLERTMARLRERQPKSASFYSDDRSEHRGGPLAQMPAWDVLNLHWIANFLDYEDFFGHVPQDRPVVWTMHDMNPFTGGCHFDNYCGRFTEACGACPQLKSSKTEDFSRGVWKRKRNAYSHLGEGKLHIVTPSRWLAAEVKRSGLLAGRPVTVIPYGLDTEVFQPRDRATCRSVLQVPQDAKVVLFLADYAAEARKGFAELCEALLKIKDTAGLFLMVLGHGELKLPREIPVMRLEYLKDDRFLSMVYSAADVFVLPALQDNLPNTALEAQACGVPVVGFAAGGIAEVVRDGCTGLLAERGDIGGLAHRIKEILEDAAGRGAMSAKSRSAAVAEYALEVQARRYVELYEAVTARVTSKRA